MATGCEHGTRGLWQPETKTEDMGVDVVLNTYERALLSEYERRYSGTPTWAYPFAPPIPFVGDSYGTAGRAKVLIYASAENLTYSRKPNVDLPMLLPENQMIRSRYDHAVRGGTCVHIQPIDNGSLLLAGRHALTHIRHQGTFSTSSPEAFLNEIAVANPGKFSINAIQNRDYAGDGTPWLASKTFIQADLALLEPDIIILPRTILGALRSEPVNLDIRHTGRTIAPNYQITARTINLHIKPKLNNPEGKTDNLGYRTWKVPRSLDMTAYLRWLDIVAIDWIEPRTSP